MTEIAADLFDHAARYPRAPGHKEPTTSRDAARSVAHEADALRALAFGAVAAAGEWGLTAHECAAQVGRSIMTISPRLSELRKLGRIEPTSRRRRNESGRSAIAWRAAP